MTTNAQPPDPADAERTGETVTAGVERAERDSAVREPHTGAERAASGEAPVEQVRGDADMTEGQVVGEPGLGSPVPPGPNPFEHGSGGAQSEVGARTSDRESAEPDDR